MEINQASFLGYPHGHGTPPGCEFGRLGGLRGCGGSGDWFLEHMVKTWFYTWGFLNWGYLHIDISLFKKGCCVKS